MSRTPRNRFTRRELLGSARVAIVATILVALAYGAVVALLDDAVSDHLTAQVDRQLEARLTAAKANPGQAFTTSPVQTNGARYGLGIYGEPIALWAFDRSGHLDKIAAGDPLLPAATAPPSSTGSTSLNAAIAGTTYRLRWQPTASGWLLAGESLAELGHVDSVLIASELIAFPALLIAFFLVALAIGLRSAQPVEAARRRQLEFTADASHELRTPLSVIEAEVSLARSKPRAKEEYEASLDRIAGESRRLRQIVDDLLWLARADSEPAAPAGTPTDVVEVVTRCAARFSAPAEANRQSLEIATPGTEDVAPLLVMAPAEWLDRLAGTLVDNACRHSGEASRIRVETSVAGGRIVLRVEDDGPGIPEPNRGEVLQRFKRATTASNGHGLGLAIANSVVQGTNGRMSFGTSELGGALVEVSWPRWTGS